MLCFHDDNSSRGNGLDSLSVPGGAAGLEEVLGFIGCTDFKEGLRLWLSSLCVCVGGSGCLRTTLHQMGSSDLLKTHIVSLCGANANQIQGDSIGACRSHDTSFPTLDP